MNILLFSPAFLPAEAHGGVPFSTYNISKQLIRLGNNVKVVTTNRNGENELALVANSWIEYDGIPINYCKTIPGPYAFSRTMYDIAKKEIRNADIVVSSATLWNHSGKIASGIAKSFNIPHIVYLRGLLDPWAFKFKSVRKKLFWSLQGKNILDNASRIVALSESEKNAIRSMEVNTKIEVIPNGVSSIQLSKVLQRSELNKFYPQLENRRFLIFMGRIHQKKGLDVLIPAIKKVLSGFPDLLLVLAGPVEKIFEKELGDLVKKNNIHENILFAGVVNGSMKNSLLYYADGFVLTSYSEGIPIAVLEALSLGCPVVVSPQCNIPEIETSKSGWIVPTDVNAISKAVDELLSNPAQRNILGWNGIQMVEQNYSWDKIGDQTMSMLTSILADR